jgi:hypothetical protein
MNIDYTAWAIEIVAELDNRSMFNGIDDETRAEIEREIARIIEERARALG